MTDDLGKLYHVTVNNGDVVASFTARLDRWDSADGHLVAIFDNGVGIAGSDFDLVPADEAGPLVTFVPSTTYGLN